MVFSQHTFSTNTEFVVRTNVIVGLIVALSCILYSYDMQFRVNEHEHEWHNNSVR